MGKVIFEMKGPAFESELPLHLMINSLDALQSIIDKSYLISQGRERITHEDRRSFYLRSHRIRQGSLISDLEIVVNLVAPVLPIITALSPDIVWEQTKTAFDFLKVVYTASKGKVPPRIEVHGSEGVDVHLGDQHYHYNGPVYKIARVSVPSYKRLTELLQAGSVESAELFSEEAEERDFAFKFNVDDHNLFEVPTKVEEEAIELQCEIFAFDKYLNRGRLRVLENQVLPEGRYKFSVAGSQDSIEYIQTMIRPKVNLSCLKEIRVDPLKGVEISSLKILGVITNS